MEHVCGLSYLSEVVVNAEVRSPDWSPSAAKAVLSAFESTDESHGGQLAASVVINAMFRIRKLLLLLHVMR